PVLYAAVGGVGVVLFWRGVWHGADFLAQTFFAWRSGSLTIDLADSGDALLSLLAGFVLLLSTGLFVSDFIGAEIIAEGLNGEEKLTEKTESEVEMERRRLAAIENRLE